VSSGQNGSWHGRPGDDSAAQELQRHRPTGWRRLAASLREWGRSELTPRGYLAWAGVFAAMALLSVCKFLTPDHNGFFAASAIVTNVLWVGLLVAGFIAHRRRDDEEDARSKP
jgi:hypothetical protein